MKNINFSIKQRREEKVEILAVGTCRGVLNKKGNPKIAFQVTRQGYDCIMTVSVLHIEVS